MTGHFRERETSRLSPCPHESFCDQPLSPKYAVRPDTPDRNRGTKLGVAPETGEQNTSRQPGEDCRAAGKESWFSVSLPPHVARHPFPASICLQFHSNRLLLSCETPLLF